MVALAINPVTGVIVKDVNGWEDIIRCINAEFFDVVQLYFEDDKHRMRFDFYADDIGYFKDLQVCVVSSNYPPLVGTVLIAKSDEAGEELSLTPDDLALINRHIQYYTPDPEDETKHFYVLRGTAR